MKSEYLNKILLGDAFELLKALPDECVNCCVTSPPYYGLRDYGVPGQVGLEETPDEYVSKLVQVFNEVKRVLRKDGTLWLNLGDSYANNGTGGNGATGGRDKSTLASQMPPIGTTPVKRSVPAGLKSKDLIGIPWMVAFALRSAGWYLRQDIIWHKPNPMPESVTDRCTKSHEYIFLLSKSAQYYYDYRSVFEVANYDGRKDTMMKGSGKYANGYFPTDVKTQSIAKRGHERWVNTTVDGELARNKRSVWTVNTHPYSEAHFATFPERLVTDCIKAGCPMGGIVLDPFSGAGTTALVARKLDRNYVGIELNPDYIKIAEDRLKNVLGMFQ